MSVFNNVIFKDFNLTPRAKKAYKSAFNLSKEMGHNNVNNLHVAFGCAENMSQTLKNLIDDIGFKFKPEDMVEKISLLEEREGLSEKFYANKNSDPWHKEVVDAMNSANKISQKLDHHYVGIEHVLLGILDTSMYVFPDVGIQSFNKTLENYAKGDQGDSPEALSLDELLGDFSDFTEILDPPNQEENKIPSFLTSLNDLYSEGKLPDVYGRDDEIKLLIETISKKNKSNAILTGDAGVGKTAIVEALATKICQADVSSNLLGMEVMSVDLASMLSGTQYRGQFEAKFKELLQMAKQNPHIILFFDEIHTIFGAGGNQEGSIDAANMLKPMLARGEIKCIGSTTSEEYEKIFKKDSAMKRRFFNIEISEPSVEDTKKILYNCKSRYEDFHNVRYSKTIIDCVVELSSNLISNKNFPDKAFDIIDQAGSRVKIKNLKPCGELVKSHKEFVDFLSKGDQDVKKVKEKFNSFLSDLKRLNEESFIDPITIKKSDILEIVSEHGKVSVDQIKESRQGFSSFKQRISKEVFGQDAVLDKVNDLLSCAKAGFSDEDKPLASMFFVGPTSVGKTYTAKKIAKNFFGNESAIIQINMSELYDKTGISKLIGSNSGYVGYEEGGMLTKFVKENPNCVVLFDEVEKADPQVLNLLLHLLDEGYIEDNKHNKVDFSKAVVVLTSNIGHEKATKPSMGFVQDEVVKSDSYKESVKARLKPELLARINDVLVFDDLGDSDIKRIIKFELNKIKDKLQKKNINIIVKNASVDCIFNDIKSKKMHVRDVKSYVREKVQVPIAKLIVKNSKTSEIMLKSVDNKISIC
jgi:ATP-dependent Clp protease ATP-binding subunit ClpC